MTFASRAPYSAAFERISRATSLFAVLMGMTILLGWFTGTKALTTVLENHIVVKANTAAGFVLSGLALWLLNYKEPAPLWRYVTRACATLVVLLGAITLAEYILGHDLGIDHWIIRETLVYGGVYPGRMAPSTATSFVLLGTALFLRCDARRAELAQFTVVPMLVLTLLSMIGYLYGAEALFRIGTYTAIALPTALTLFILGIGLHAVRPDEGALAVVMSPGAGGFLARYILPAAVVAPIVLGWLHQWVESLGRFNELVVEALAAVAQVVVLTGAAIWSIRNLHRVDLERQRVADEVLRLNLELEERVRTRTLELEQTNKLLEIERDHLQALMDHVPDTIYFKDTESRFTRINPAQARTLGLTDPQQAIGRRDSDFFAPEAAARALADDQRVIRTGEAMIDRREAFPQPNGQTRWFSSTKVPMTDRDGNVVGLIGVSRDITERVTDEQTAGAERSQLRERISQMLLIIELAEELQACATDQEVYQVVARLAGRLFPGVAGALYAIEALQQSMETAVAWGDPLLAGQAFELDDCWALRRGRAHLWQGELSGELCPHLTGAPPTFSLCLPLAAAGERLGVLHLRSSPTAPAGSLDEVQFQSAYLVADSVALAWANVRLRASLRDQASRDPLTGLYNRRHMQSSLARELRRAARGGCSMGVMMLDVDQFKRVNDAHGHDAGDAVLRELGRFLKDHTRDGDIACRLGGEEFLVILPDANLEQTAARAEKHRQNFRELRILYAGGQVEAPTLSIGVAAYPKHGATAEEILRAADQALYGAKAAGRDRVVVAE